MGTVRCKMLCISTTKRADKLQGVEFAPVFSDDPNSENKKFWEASPTGHFTLDYATNINFEAGKEYYVDIIPAN